MNLKYFFFTTGRNLGQTEDMEAEFTLMKTNYKTHGFIRHLSLGLSVLIIDIVIFLLLKERQFAPAIIMAIPIIILNTYGNLILIGVAIYLFQIKQWNYAALTTVSLIIAWFGYYVGDRHKSYISYNSNADIDPLEKMPVLYVMILQKVFIGIAVFTSGIIQIISIALLCVVLFFQLLRYWTRLSSPWRKLHFPIMIRYTGMCVLEDIKSVKEGREYDIYNALSDLTSTIYPNASESQISNVMDNVKKSINNFSDRIILEKYLVDKNKNANKKDFKEVLNCIEKRLGDPSDEFIISRWYIAEIVDMEYGMEEKCKYLCAVFMDEAK